MHYILRCRAPASYRPSDACDREFTSLSPYRLYCCQTCANRAHRANKVARDRAAGYGSSVHPLSSAISAEQRVKAAIADPLTQLAAGSVAATTADIEKALAIHRIIEVDSEAELLALGYSAHKKAERWDSSGPDPRAAEPKLSTPTSDESNPPQFENEEYEPNPDDPYADYQAPKGSDL